MLPHYKASEILALNRSATNDEEAKQIELDSYELEVEQKAIMQRLGDQVLHLLDNAEDAVSYLASPALDSDYRPRDMTNEIEAAREE